MNSNTLNLATVVTLVALLFCIFRDTLIEKEGTMDLRNRIVGSRLQKDGILPYYHKWKQGDDIRYYDPANSSKHQLSNITATPFYHTLLYPICDLPQRQISRLWLLIEYLSLFIITFLGYRLSTTIPQKVLILFTSTLFLFTEAWKIHTGCGQLYLSIPLGSMIFYYCIHHKKQLAIALIASLIAVSIILIRPNFIVFFLPFIFLLKNFDRRFIILFFSSGILFTALYFSNEKTRLFWGDYKNAMVESIIIHQETKIIQPENNNQYLLKLEKWEGWDTEQMKKDSSSNNFIYYSEHGNLFVLYYHIFKERISVKVMNALSAITLILLLAGYYIIDKKKHIITLPNSAILGSCLYMVTDFLSPVWRHQYNTIPWIFPLIIIASVYNARNKFYYLLLGTGLFLNIINTDLIKMEHTIGEYLILITFIILSLTRPLNAAK